MPYEKLDAWKACHALVLATMRAVKGRELEQDLLDQLCYTSIRSASKLAFGAGTQSRKMFLHSAERSAGYLSEFAYILNLARVMGALPDKVCTELDALRGRASFYTVRLLTSLIAPSEPSGE